MPNGLKYFTPQLPFQQTIEELYGSGIASFPGAYDKSKEYVTEPLDLESVVSDYYGRFNEDPTLGGAASMISQYAMPGGAIGAGAIALADMSGGGLGTVGGAMAEEDLRNFYNRAHGGM